MTQNGIDAKAVIDAIPTGIVVTNGRERGGIICFVNAAFTQLTGYSANEALGRELGFLQGPVAGSAANASLVPVLAGSAPVPIEMLSYRKSGEQFWAELQMGPQHDEQGQVTGFVSTITDISERRKREVERTDIEGRLASVIENMPGFVFQRTLTADGTYGITYCSPSFAKLIGLASEGDLQLADLWNRIHAEDQERVRQSISKSAADLAPLALEFRLTTLDGRDIWIRNQSRPRRNPDGGIVWEGVGLDITAEHEAAERLAYLAYHDPLTGLPNRLLLEGSMGRALGARGSAVGRLVLFIVDIDGFEEFNNAYGHASADVVLRLFAKRIADFGETRDAYAARIGSDEFGVFQTSTASDQQLSELAADLKLTLSQPLMVGDTEITLDASIGVLAYPMPAADDPIDGPAAVAEMMRRATLALTLAKRVGRGGHRLYASDDDDRQRNQVTLRHSLRRGIAERQFQLHYHPFVDLTSGEIVGAEALVRWNHPQLGLQRPDHFIPLAESSGLIVPLGAWIAEEAMRQVREWETRGLVVPRIAINVSGVQLRDPGFIKDIEQALARTGARPEQFELELTEGFMIEASTAVMATLIQLKRMGFSLAVDDFGTGHASFQYLRDFPVDKVKIDQTFVCKMVVDSSDASIIRAIIALARSMQLSVIAEGIETSVQHAFLRDEGCKVGQGYLFSLPLDAEDFAYLLAQRVRLPTSSFATPPLLFAKGSRR